MENTKTPGNIEALPALEREDIKKALEIELMEVLQLDPRTALKRIAQMGRTIKNLAREEGAHEVVLGTSPQLRFDGVSTGNKITLQTKESGTYTIEYTEEDGETLLFQGGKKIEDEDYQQALDVVMSALAEISLDSVRINRDD